MFYTERARQHDETYAKRQKQKQREEAENIKASDVEYDEDDEKFDEMFNEFMQKSDKRDYGPPYGKKGNFGSPTEDVNLSKSGQNLNTTTVKEPPTDADLDGRKENIDRNKNATPPMPKPRTKATKNKAEPQAPNQPTTNEQQTTNTEDVPNENKMLPNVSWSQARHKPTTKRPRTLNKL